MGSSEDRLEQRLRAQLQRACVAPHSLGEYHLGLLPPAEGMTISTHLQTCPHCQAELKGLVDFLANADPSPLTTLVERVVEWGQGLLAGGGQPALAGVRGAASPSTRTFEVDSLWIAAAVQAREDGRRDLLALIVRNDGTTVTQGEALLAGDGHVYAGAVDANGNLRLTGIAPGTYELTLHIDAETIRIRGVSL